MRGATKEEQESVDNYITSISTATIPLSVIEDIKAEIVQIADEEQKHDEKWAIGLRYAVKIIDKYKAESEE